MWRRPSVGCARAQPTLLSRPGKLATEELVRAAGFEGGLVGGAGVDGGQVIRQTRG